MEIKREGEEMSAAVQGYHSRPQVGIPTTEKSYNVSVLKKSTKEPQIRSLEASPEFTRCIN
jgi:hypothetical protein